MDLVKRTGRQEFGEVAGAHSLARNGRLTVVARTRFRDAFNAVHEERLVAPIIELRYHYRAANRTAPAGVVENRVGGMGGVGEVVVGERSTVRVAECLRCEQL